MLFKNQFGKLNSRLVKFLSKRIANLQSDNEYLISRSGIVKFHFLNSVDVPCFISYDTRLGDKR